MVTTTSLKVGESLTIGLYFNNNYQLPTTCNLITYISGVCIGNLFTQEPPIDEVGIYYTMRLSSQDTSKMRGYRDLIVVLDDPLGFGNKKTIVGGILFDRLADEFISTSENHGYNMLIGMTIDESVVTGNIELLNAIKGDDGADGSDGVGIIPGGLASQVLSKKSDNDFDTEWVDNNSIAPIETISINSVEQPIVNKNVDITVPTKTSELEKDDVYTKTEINNKLSAVYKFKGSVLTYDLLPTDAQNADVWNVTNGTTPELNGMNYAWNSDLSVWDELGGVIGLATLTENGLMSKEDFAALAALKVHDHTGQVITPDAINITKVYTALEIAALPANTLFWDDAENALSYTLPDGGNIAIGKEMFDYYTNIDSVTLVNGDIVSIFPISGNRKGIKRTDFTNASSVKNMIGMVTVPTILVNGTGRITTVGEVHELDTDLYNEGTQIYGNPLLPGKWTAIEPDAPNYAVTIGSIVVKHQNVGIVHLQLTKTCKLNELADVNGTEPTTGSILVYNQALGVHDFTSKVSDFATSAHTHDDRYFTESEVTTLLSGKSDTSHLHTGVYSSLSMNVLTAGVGATEYTLLRNIQTNILNTLPSGVNSTITLPTPVAGELNESVLHFSTGAIVPTLVYNAFTPVWLGGTALTLKINKTYTIVFEQVRTTSGTWIVKTSWGEF